MKKTVKVVMLATEKALVIGDLIIEVDRPNILVKYTGTASFMKTPIPQHLYLISDEEIKEGDWYYSAETKQVYNQNTHHNTVSCHKIIATTDNSINVNYPIAEIPESFIQAYIKAYNEGSPITEVAVEMTTGELEANSVGLSLNGGGNRPFIKTRSDNTVIIHKTTQLDLKPYKSMLLSCLALKMSRTTSDYYYEVAKLHKLIQDNL